MCKKNLIHLSLCLNDTRIIKLSESEMYIIPIHFNEQQYPEALLTIR